MMKISTLNCPITHRQNDEKLFAAIEEIAEELAPMDEVAEALEETLKIMNPNVREVIADKSIVIIEIGVSIKEVDITGFNFADLFTTLLAAVIAQ